MTRAEQTAHCVSGEYRLEVLNGVPHWVPEEAADRLGQLLVDHLQTARERKSATC